MSKKATDSTRRFTGYGGQMAVVGELLIRGCNAAVPEMDVGTDVFAFRDDGPDVARIQVKAARAEPFARAGRAGYRARFNIPLRQLRAADDPPLYYALAARVADQWASFLVISRRRLREYEEGTVKFGHRNKSTNELELRIEYLGGTAICGPVDLTPHLNAWGDLPPVVPPIAPPFALGVWEPPAAPT